MKELNGPWGCFCRLDKCSRRAPGYFTLIGDRAPPAARDRSEVARAQKQRWYPLIGNRAVVLPGVMLPGPGAHYYHADVIYLLP